MLTVCLGLINHKRQTDLSAPITRFCAMPKVCEAAIMSIAITSTKQHVLLRHGDVDQEAHRAVLRRRQIRQQEDGLHPQRHQREQRVQRLARGRDRRVDELVRELERHGVTERESVRCLSTCVWVALGGFIALVFVPREIATCGPHAAPA
jgi:hypothetical protein